MNWKVAATLQDRKVLGRKGLVVEWVDLSILHFLRLRCRGLAPFHLMESRVRSAIHSLSGVAVRRFVHMSQVRVVAGIGLGLGHLLALRTRGSVRI